MRSVVDVICVEKKYTIRGSDMKTYKWGRIFIDSVDNLYLIPTLVWSKKYKIFALIWLKFELGILI